MSSDEEEAIRERPLDFAYTLLLMDRLEHGRHGHMAAEVSMRVAVELCADVRRTTMETAFPANSPPELESSPLRCATKPLQDASIPCPSPDSQTKPHHNSLLQALLHFKTMKIKRLFVIYFPRLGTLAYSPYDRWCNVHRPCAAYSALPLRRLSSQASSVSPSRIVSQRTAIALS